MSRNLSIDLSDGTKSNDGAAGEGDSVQTDIENLFSGSGDDTIFGGEASDLIAGGAGKDSINGGGGNDKLIGSRDSDTLVGGGGINLYSLVDGVRDDFDVLLDGRGLPINTFISGDLHTDYSTISAKLLG